MKVRRGTLVSWVKTCFCISLSTAAWTLSAQTTPTGMSIIVSMSTATARFRMCPVECWTCRIATMLSRTPTACPAWRSTSRVTQVGSPFSRSYTYTCLSLSLSLCVSLSPLSVACKTCFSRETHRMWPGSSHTFSTLSSRSHTHIHI